jgi:methionyl-tRNA formyltransferase
MLERRKLYAKITHMAAQAHIVFMGTPDFAVPTLQALVKAGEKRPSPFNMVGVVTQPDRPAGRGRALMPPAVKTAALRLGLPVLQPEKLRLPEAMQQLQTWSPDVIIVAAFGQILRPEVLDLPKYGCINVHGSILPRWRGASPIQAAILAGDQETGITIMKMDPGIDTGPILSQRYIPIAPDETGGTLFEKLAPLGAELLLETLPKYLSGEIQPRLQPEEGATYTKMIKKEEGLLDPARPAGELERRVRAFNPWPGAYLLYNGKPLKVEHASIAPVTANAGQRVIHQGLPALGTPEGLLVLEEVRPAGKKTMSGKAFLAGARGWA